MICLTFASITFNLCLHASDTVGLPGNSADSCRIIKARGFALVVFTYKPPVCIDTLAVAPHRHAEIPYFGAKIDQNHQNHDVSLLEMDSVTPCDSVDLHVISRDTVNLQANSAD